MAKRSVELPANEPISGGVLSSKSFILPNFKLSDFVRSFKRDSLEEDPQKVAKIESAAAKVKKLQIDNSGREDFYALRKRWSFWIIVWISILISFNIMLTAGIGFQFLKFQEYQWFITAITAETFLQIVALGFIAVSFLFDRGENENKKTLQKPENKVK